MTPNRTINLLRVLFIAFAATMGVRVGEVVLVSEWQGGIVGLIVGLLIVLFDRLLLGVSLRLFSAATCGLLVGLVASRFLMASGLLRYAQPQTVWIISLCTYSVFGYLGMMLAVRSNRDEFALIIPYVRFRQTAVHDIPLLVDTSVLIDGRVIEVCLTGFLSSSMVVPRVVIEELQRLADSAEPVKRERGRRGLDLLRGIQQRPEMAVTIHESATSDSDVPVDTRLVHVAQLLQAQLLTLDSNLARVARLQGISVLNLNELNRALHPTVAPGDEMELTLVKPGRDSHQAVGYLPDGSMIVVNHGRTQVGETVAVVIGGALQTASGRMYFAELKTPAEKAAPRPATRAEA